MIFVIVVAVVVIGGYFYLNGVGSHSANLPGTDQAQTYWDQVQHDPHFYTALGAVLVALAVRFLWANMKPPVRYAVVAALTVVLFYVFSKGHS